MAVPRPLTSPWVIEFGDYVGKVVRLTVTFDGAHALTGATLYRDAGCQWTKILIGVGADGVPDSTPKRFDVSTLNDASRTATPAQMAAVGLTTIEDVTAFQITAGR